MTTIDNIMALADDYAEEYSSAMVPQTKQAVIDAKEALRTALTEALNHIVSVNDMVAQPVREPLNKSEWPKHPSAYVNDEHIGYSKSDLDSYAMQVLRSHGIGGEK